MGGAAHIWNTEVSHQTPAQSLLLVDSLSLQKTSQHGEHVASLLEDVSVVGAQKTVLM